MVAISSAILAYETDHEIMFMSAVGATLGEYRQLVCRWNVEKSTGKVLPAWGCELQSQLPFSQD